MTRRGRDEASRGIWRANPTTSIGTHAAQRRRWGAGSAPASTGIDSSGTASPRPKVVPRVDPYECGQGPWRRLCWWLAATNHARSKHRLLACPSEKDAALAGAALMEQGWTVLVYQGLVDVWR